MQGLGDHLRRFVARRVASPDLAMLPVRTGTPTTPVKRAGCPLFPYGHPTEPLLFSVDAVLADLIPEGDNVAQRLQGRAPEGTAGGNESTASIAERVGQAGRSDLPRTRSVRPDQSMGVLRVLHKGDTRKELICAG